MRNDPGVIDLVVRARDGDAAAWDAIVERYAALVWSVGRRYDLDPVDIDEVGGNVWLRLVESLGGLREPAALPGWLVTTTQRECLKLLSAKKRLVPVDDPDLDRGPELGGGPGSRGGPPPGSDEGLLVEERRHVLRLAFADLPERCQRLLSMLFKDPPMSYGEISATLDIPIGAIGPDRGRCLDRMRRSRAVASIAPAWLAGTERR